MVVVSLSSASMLCFSIYATTTEKKETSALFDVGKNMALAVAILTAINAFFNVCVICNHNAFRKSQGQMTDDVREYVYFTLPSSLLTACPLFLITIDSNCLALLPILSKWWSTSSPTPRSLARPWTGSLKSLRRRTRARARGHPGWLRRRWRWTLSLSSLVRLLLERAPGVVPTMSLLTSQYPLSALSRSMSLEEEVGRPVRRLLVTTMTTRLLNQPAGGTGRGS